jgi:glycerol kinase
VSAYVLAIDQGTTNSKAVLLNKAGRIAARSAVQVPVSYPQPGWVEQSLEEIWNTVLAAVDQCLAQVNGPQIAAIGISNQRESVALWDRSSGTPIGPCITWQCRRSAERIDRIRNSQTEVLVSSKTGLGLDPLFPAAKIGWLLDNTPRARALLKNDMLCTGTVDTWLLFKLTGGGTYATDAGNASRTQLFDITTKRWDDELCELFEVPKKILPRVMSSDATFGVTAGVGRLVAGIPIRSVMGDSHAALFGHGIRHTGEAKATYGTGSSLMALTDIPIRSRFGLSSTIAWQRGTDVAYALEGNISVSAQAAAWVAELLGLPNVESLTELATTVSDSDGVVVVPAFAGLGAPHWKDRVRAVIAGMSLSTKRAHVPGPRWKQ